MFERHIQQLQDPNSAKRREAIIGLGKLGDTRAIKPLASLYKSETDPALRDLVAKAGKHLQALEKQEMATPAPVKNAGYSEGVSDDDDLVYAKINESQSDKEKRKSAPQPVAPTFATKPSTSESSPVSESKRKQARAKLANAFRYKTVQDNDNAFIELCSALALDPELARDENAKNLAAALPGGAEMLLAAKSQGNIMPVAAPMAAGRQGFANFFKLEPANSGEVADLVVLGLILLVLQFFLYFILVYYTLSLVVYDSTPFNTREIVLSIFSFGDVLSSFVGVAFKSVFIVVIQIAIVYFVGIQMGGVAPWAKFAKMFLTKIATVYVPLLLASAFLLGGIWSGSPRTFSSLTTLAGLLVICSAFYSLISFSIAVGRVQEFGSIKGFVSAFVGGLATAIIASVLRLI
jgi:hypothetical protein